MKKYLVDVFLPASGRHCDVYLPAEKRIYEVIILLERLAESLSGGSYKGTRDAMLLNADNGMPFDLNSTVYDAGIRNASQLILI